MLIVHTLKYASAFPILDSTTKYVASPSDGIDLVSHIQPDVEDYLILFLSVDPLWFVKQKSTFHAYWFHILDNAYALIFRDLLSALHKR